MGEVGRTRLHTRRDRRVLTGAGILAVLGLLGSLLLAGLSVSWCSGDVQVPRIDLHSPLVDRGAPDIRTLVTFDWPVPAGWTIAVAVPLWALWLRLTVKPMIAGLRREPRHRGLARLRSIRAVMSARAVRRAGRYTLPTSRKIQRNRESTSAFGFSIGYPLEPSSRRRLWADWEQRIRIVARTGWGKTERLLVPIIRQLPGAAVVSSTEPGIFEKTVAARQHGHATLRWTWLTWLMRRWLPANERPVAVVDFTPPEQRYAAGYPRVRWSPIVGSEDFTIAHRRAVALVAGIDYRTDNVHGSDNDRFFRDSAAEVLAAWLHAAALGDRTIDDLIEWLDKADDPTPTRILRDDPRADRSAALNLRNHLDQAAGRTTSGVKRYLTLTMNALATEDSRTLCGGSHDDQFDMEAFIRADGTLYLLADAGRIDRARPLLSLLAAEMFLAAEAAARRTRQSRLPQPFIAVLDELRYAITVPNLPYVASTLRKYGIGYVYAIQSTSQEDSVYGPDAPALRAAAGVSIYGGIDIDSARELAERAGVTTVVTPTRGDDRHTEQLQQQNTLTVGDQQRLADGEATVVVRGLAPFLARIPTFRERRFMNRRIMKEVDAVTIHVTIARERELALRRAYDIATATGANFPRTEP